jgi:hypothetical protein
MLRIRVDVHHHFEVDKGLLAELKAIGGKLETLTKETKMQNAKLAAAIAAMQEEVTDSTGKLASIKAAILGMPALVAAAVASALAEANVDDDAAADLVDQARQTMSDSVDDTLAAINANPAPGEDTGATTDTGAGDTSTGTDTGQGEVDGPGPDDAGAAEGPGPDDVEQP